MGRIKFFQALLKLQAPIDLTIIVRKTPHQKISQTSIIVTLTKMTDEITIIDIIGIISKAFISNDKDLNTKMNLL